MDSLRIKNKMFQILYKIKNLTCIVYKYELKNIVLFKKK